MVDDNVPGRTTSVSLEHVFWDALKEIAAGMNISTSGLIQKINSTSQHDNLSSAIRVSVFDHYRERAEQSVVSYTARRTVRD
jgi:predicted DNA-binding ribbon-helix-helix protein